MAQGNKGVITGSPWRRSSDKRPGKSPLPAVGGVLFALSFILLLVWQAPPTHAFQGMASYLPLHTFMEFFAIIVAMLVFGVGWHAHSRERAGNLIVLACAFLAVGLIDFAHTLSFKGMPDLVTPSHPEKAINFWLAARSLESLALLAVAILPWRPFRRDYTRYLLLAGSLAITALVYWIGLYHADLLPRTFIDGQGLTPVKVGTEYVIVTLHLVTALLLLIRCRRPQPFDVTNLLAAAFILILSELSFTLYSSVSDIFNLLGHVYKVIAYVFIYKAVFVDSVHEPYRRLHEAQEAVWQEKERAQVTLHSIGDAVITTDAGGYVEYLNPVAEGITGWSNEDARGIPVHRVFQIYNEETGEKAPNPVDQCLREVRVIGLSNHTVLVRRDGQRFAIEDSAAPIRDRRGHIVGVVMVFYDVTERKNFEAQLKFMADHDSLTGLFNRRRFEQELSCRMTAAEAGGTGGAMLFMDVDNFKYINDTLGHRAGDSVLVTLVGILRDLVGEKGVLARLGGDELAVLLPRADADEALALAEEVVRAVGHHSLEVEGHPVDVTISTGIALFPAHGRTPAEVMAHADLAMYRAKEDGRNRSCMYSAEHDQHLQMQSQLFWTKRIRDALDNDRFRLYLQPILDLREGSVSQYEALLRMIGEDGEVILPGAFLTVAERFGLMRDIDRWVVRRAIGLLARFHQDGAGFCLEVNLSGKAFSDSELLPLIQEDLAATGVDPARLVFEITETTAVANIEEAQRFIKALKGLGCRFALDDFGVGFSSFNYLKHLPVDYLKIDGSFIHDLSQDRVDKHLVKAMVEVARGLGKETIAECVGDGETVRILREHGVDFAQGFFLGRPAPAEQLLLEARDEPAV